MGGDLSVRRSGGRTGFQLGASPGLQARVRLMEEARVHPVEPVRPRFSPLEVCLAGPGAEERGQGAFWPYGAQSLSGCLDRPDKDIKG